MSAAVASSAGVQEPHPYLVKDINTTVTSEGSDPRLLACTNTQCFFSADYPTAQALWRTDATSDGTWLLVEAGVWSDQGFFVLEPWFFFSHYDEAHGRELWRTDGTPDGTCLLKDIHAGPQTSNPSSLGRLGDLFLFSASDSDHGCELWKTDGSETGTSLVAELTPGVEGTVISSFATLGTSAYFLANHALWRTDGTDSGTVQVVENYGFHLLASGGSLFFQMHPTISTYDLWRTDGTASGAMLVKDGFTSVLNFNQHGDPNFFIASHASEGSGLWFTDGTTSGTVFLCPAHELFWAEGRTVYFSADDSEHGLELWRSDGEPGDCRMVKDVRLGPEPSSPYAAALIGDAFYFGADDGVCGKENWLTDGTEEGTRLVTDLASGSTSSFEEASRIGFAGRLLFRAADDGIDHELWSTDGTEEGTHLVKNIRPDSTSSRPFALAAIGETLLFQASDGGSVHLFRSDGSEEGTQPLAVIPSAYEGGSVPPAVAGSLYFTFVDCASALWRSDAESEGTFQLLGSMAANCRHQLAAAPDQVFFVADGELWRSDGSVGGTSLVKDINPAGSDITSDAAPVWAMDALLFEANDGDYGTQLWRSDGTEGGTYKVKTLTEDPYWRLDRFTKVGNRAFFISQEDYSGFELWVSDGTETGTQLVHVFVTQSIVSLTNLSGTLYFVVSTPGSTTELWRTNGTPEGTTLVSDLGSLLDSSQLTPAGGNLFFATTDHLLDTKLWRSDGTSEGTLVVKSLGYAPYRNAMTGLTTVNETLYFQGFDWAHGFELWSSDGTTEGTAMAFDVAPGPESSAPDLFSLAGNILFFRAATPDSASELWALDLTDSCTLLLTNETLSGVRLERACYEILVGPDVTEAPSADVTLRAGTRVVLRNGVTVSSGSRLAIGTDPTLGSR